MELRCTCASTHFLNISIDEPEDSYLYLEGCWCWPGLGGWFRRLWSAVRGKSFHEPCVLLDGESVDTLIAYLNAHRGKLWTNPKPQ